MKDPTITKRRWQWSLRTLIAVMIIVAVILAFWVASAQRQRRAVAEIERLGGHVEYDFDDEGLEEPSAPAWAVELFGIDYFAHVVGVGLSGGRGDTVGNKILARVEDLPRLKWLEMDGGGATDAGMVHVRNLTDLERLGLHGTWVGDEGLAHLSKITRLTSLNLSGSNVTDAGLKRLTHLKRLRTFYIFVGPRWGISEEGLAAFLKEMPSIRNFSGPLVPPAPEAKAATTSQNQ
jgi:hypothetical protein